VTACKFQSVLEQRPFLRIGPNLFKSSQNMTLCKAWSRPFNFLHAMVRGPLLCNGLDLTFNFLHVTMRDPLLCNGLYLTFKFLHVTMHNPLLCNGFDLVFFLFFSSNSNLSFVGKSRCLNFLYLLNPDKISISVFT